MYCAFLIIAAAAAFTCMLALLPIMSVLHTETKNRDNMEGIPEKIT